MVLGFEFYSYVMYALNKEQNPFVIYKNWWHWQSSFDLSSIANRSYTAPQLLSISELNQLTLYTPLLPEIVTHVLSSYCDIYHKCPMTHKVQGYVYHIPLHRVNVFFKKEHFDQILSICYVFHENCFRFQVPIFVEPTCS